MNLEETYDRIAEDWHRDHASDEWWQSGTYEFIKRLPEGASVLDVGCGSGVKSEYLIAHGLRVVGIDLSKNMIDIAKREVPEGDFRHLSMTELDMIPELFAGVFAQASLLHIPRAHAGQVVQKMVGRTKADGLVYIAVKELQEGRPEEAVERENDYGYDYERFFSYYRMTDLEKSLADADLKMVWQSRNPHPNGKTAWLQIVGQK